MSRPVQGLLYLCLFLRGVSVQLYTALPYVDVLLLLLLGAKLPLMGVESFGLLNDIFPLPSILDAGYPVFNLHLANILLDVIHM
jgi:hypothetical protein